MNLFEDARREHDRVRSGRELLVVDEIAPALTDERIAYLLRRGWNTPAHDPDAELGRS